MAKLICPECKNDKKFKNAQMSQGKYKATCSDCGTVVEGQGGMETDTIEGGMTFNL